MLELEQEILDPSGIPTVEPPKMILKGVLISERCGIMYHVGECAGMRYGAPLRSYCSDPDKILVRGSTIVMSLRVCHRPPHRGGAQAKTKAADTGWSSLIYLVMLVLLNRQQTVSWTPDELSRLSKWTFICQAWIDMVTVIIVGVSACFSPLGLILETLQLMSQATNPTANASIPFITLAALAVILFSCEVVSPCSQFLVLVAESLQRLFYLICEVQGSEDTTSRHAAATAAPIRDTLVMVFMKHLIETLQNDPRVKICEL